MSTSSPVSEAVPAGEAYPSSNNELEQWFYPRDRAALSDPFTENLPRVTLFYASDYGGVEPPNPNPLPYVPPKSKEDARNLSEYLTSFTVPHYGSDWAEEVKKAGSPRCPRPNVHQLSAGPPSRTENWVRRIGTH